MKNINILIHQPHSMQTRRGQLLPPLSLPLPSFPMELFSGTLAPSITYQFSCLFSSSALGQGHTKETGNRSFQAMLSY
jgi:hypothetical protein